MVWRMFKKKTKGRDLRPGMTIETRKGGWGTITKIEDGTEGSLAITFKDGFHRPTGDVSRGPVNGFGRDEDFWVK